MRSIVSESISFASMRKGIGSCEKLRRKTTGLGLHTQASSKHMVRFLERPLHVINFLTNDFKRSLAPHYAFQTNQKRKHHTSSTHREKILKTRMETKHRKLNHFENQEIVSVHNICFKPSQHLGLRLSSRETAHLATKSRCVSRTPVPTGPEIVLRKLDPMAITCK